MTRGLGGHSPANVTHNLKGIHFPAGKADLVRQAEHNGAEPAVMEVIQGMPDRNYENIADVMKAVGEVEHGPERG